MKLRIWLLRAMLGCLAMQISVVRADVVFDLVEVVNGADGQYLFPESDLSGQGWSAYQVVARTTDGDMFESFDLEFRGNFHQRWQDQNFDGIADPTPVGLPSDARGDSHFTYVVSESAFFPPLEDTRTSPGFTSPLVDGEFEYGVGTVLSGAWAVLPDSRSSESDVAYIVVPDEENLFLDWSISTSEFGRFRGSENFFDRLNPPGPFGFVATQTSDSVVHSVDLRTGHVTALGPSGISNIRALEYSDGVLYAAGDGGLYSIDPGTGAGTFVANLPQVDNLAATSDGNLYASSPSGSSSVLFTIDPRAGEATSVGVMVPPVASDGLAIGPSNEAVGWDSGAGELYQVDLTSAMTTVSGSHAGAQYRALDYGPDGTLYGWTGSEVRRIEGDGNSSSLVQGFDVPAFGFTLLPEAVRTWNHAGPGRFEFDNADNWTPAQPPSDHDVSFIHDGDVEVLLGQASETKGLRFRNGFVRLVSTEAASLTTINGVVISDPLATGVDDAAIVVVDGRRGIDWNIGRALEVGNDGHGQLELSNGATVEADRLVIADEPGTSAEVVVSGSGAALTVRNTLRDKTLPFNRPLAVEVAGPDATGVLSVADGSLVSTPGKALVGVGPGADGTLTVEGSDTRLITRDITFGGAGGTGRLSIIGPVTHTRVFTGDAIVADYDRSTGPSNGSVHVSGPGAYWELGEGIFGRSGDAEIVVTDGGQIRARSHVYVGGQFSDSAMVTVRGSSGNRESSFDVSGRLYVGAGGRGTLLVDSDGLVHAGNGLFVGSGVGGDGVVRVGESGVVSNTLLRILSELSVGVRGRGLLHVAAGEVTVGRSASIGATEYSDAFGIIQTEGQSRLNISGSMLVGADRGRSDVNGVLTASQNSVVTIDENLQLFRFGRVELTGDESALTVDPMLSAGMALKNNGELSVSYASATFAEPSVNERFGQTFAGNAHLSFVGGLINEGAIHLFDASLIGDVINDSGSLRVGGESRVEGNLHLEMEGALHLNLAGPDPTQFDALEVSGDLHLGGRLRLNIDDNYAPLPGDEFVIVKASGATSGTFDRREEGAAVARFGDVRFSISYQGGDGNDVAVVASAVPEPASLLLAAASLAICCARRTTHRSRLPIQ